MSIKSQGGVFGRNPTFNDVTVDGDLSIAGTLSVGGETITGLSYQGGWNADTNTPDIANSGPVTGQFWIVSVDGSTDVGGITNWTSGDWALYDGTNWQRVEGGNTDLSTGVTGQLAVANGGTGAADEATARTNLGLGTAATTAATDYATAAQGSLADSAVQPADISNMLETSDIGVTVQGYDANILTSSDIGSTVQGYDADTAKLDVAQTWTANQTFPNDSISGDAINGGTATPNDISVSGGITLSGATARTLLLKCTDTTVDNNQQFGVIDFESSDASTGAGGVRCRIEGKAANSAGGIGNSALVFSVAANSSTTLVETLRIQDGNLKLPSGSGIDFSATSGTGTSELFDDYEEGTWTPTNPTVGFSSATGNYTKIGNTVIAYFDVTWNSNSSGIDAIVRGFPFAGGGNGAASTSIMYTNYGTANLYFNDSSTPGCKLVNSSGTDLSNSNVSTKNFKGMAVYKAA